MQPLENTLSERQLTKESTNMLIISLTNTLLIFFEIREVCVCASDLMLQFPLKPLKRHEVAWTNMQQNVC